MFRLPAGVLLCCAAALPAAAQTARDAAQPVTLEQAVQEATANNLGLLAERYNLSIAEARVVQAGLRPNVVFSMRADYQDLLRRGFTMENSAGPPELNWRTDFLIEGGHKRQRRIEVARDARSVAQLQLLDSMRQLTFEVQGAFVNAVLAKESLARPKTT